MTSEISRVIIVGGGASGLMASICASKKGNRVKLIEKNDRVGKKLLTTGNGRCNLSNKNISSSDYHGGTADFAMTVIKQFDNNASMNFFKELGLELSVEENGKIFPQSMQASSVLDLLRLEAESSGVEIVTGSEIKTIIRDKEGIFELTDKTGITHKSGRVILACGGKAAPQTGSDGYGYKLAGMMGHSVVSPLPALVALKLSGDLHKAMEKMFWNAEVSLLLNNQKLRTISGDIIFTNYGISGLAILDLSRDAVYGLANNKTVEIEINFLPKFSFNEKIDSLRRRKALHPGRLMENYLTGVINKRIGQTLIKSSDIKLGAMVSEISESEIIRLAEVINGCRFKVTGDNGWANAQVTAGGVDCSEVNARTLESKLTGGLYFCGEILDIDGISGGYNLQWAWSSGFVAGSLPLDRSGGF